jgi:hypothetical protein
MLEPECVKSQKKFQDSPFIDMYQQNIWLVTSHKDITSLCVLFMHLYKHFVVGQAAVYSLYFWCCSASFNANWQFMQVFEMWIGSHNLVME